MVFSEKCSGDSLVGFLLFNHCYILFLLDQCEDIYFEGLATTDGVAFVFERSCLARRIECFELQSRAVQLN